MRIAAPYLPTRPDRRDREHQTPNHSTVSWRRSGKPLCRAGKRHNDRSQRQARRRAPESPGLDTRSRIRRILPGRPRDGSGACRARRPGRPSRFPLARRSSPFHSLVQTESRGPWTAPIGRNRPW
jgi:hypothetical protein